MSHIVKTLVAIPDDVVVTIKNKCIIVNGRYGNLSQFVHSSLCVQQDKGHLVILSCATQIRDKALVGTLCSLLKNMMVGVSEQFVKRLLLVGIGYRVTISGNKLILSLGFSHTITYEVPIDITIECPSQNEIILKGVSKQLVGQVSANLRALRPPESFKGKGIRYSDEIVHIKEVKKK